VILALKTGIRQKTANLEQSKDRIFCISTPFFEEYDDFEPSCIILLMNNGN